MILRRIFEHQKEGFYIDIGAHHPKRFSNTYLLYKKGWKGINIDAMPGSMTSFNKTRSRDKNLEIAISNTSDLLTYFIFNDIALNTFDKNLAETRQNQKYKITGRKLIQTQSLREILKEHLDPEQIIDLLSVDIEEFDLNALMSNDWTLFRPKYILVEQKNFKISASSKNSTYNFLVGCEYELFAKTLNTLFFKDVNQ